MKKTLLLAAVGLLAASSSMDAATVYFDNTKGWDAVYSYAFNPADAAPFPQAEKTTIDGHELYYRDTDKSTIIFLNNSDWVNQKQTANLEVQDGYVYDGDSQLVAKIVNNSYQAVDPSDIPEKDLYLRGTMTNWDCLDAWKFTKGADGLYTLSNVSILANATWKVATNDWNESYGSPQGDTQIIIEAGKTFTLTPKPEGGDNADLKNTVALSNVTLTFDRDNNQLTVSDGSGEMEPMKWFCAWDFEEQPQGASWKFGNEMEEQEEGTFKIHVEVPENTAATNYFALFRGYTNTGWNDGVRYQPVGSGNQAVTVDTEYEIVQGTDYVWTLGNGNWTVVVNPTDENNITISFNLGDSTGEANVLIDRIADTEYDGIYESYAMEETEGDANTFTWEGTLNQGDRLKFNIHGVDYYYDPSNGTIKGDDEDFDNAVTIDYPLMTVTEENNGEVTFDYTSAVKITVDVDNTTVTVDVLDAPRVSLTLTRGAESQIHAMTREDATSRVYTCHPIMCEPGDRVDFRLLNTRYVFVSSDTRAAETYTLKVAEEGEEAPELPIETSQEITFTVDAANSTLTMGDGVNTVVIDITAAENAEVLYFNLQGIQIERPENGMFIEVRGNKASKVMVK